MKAKGLQTRHAYGLLECRVYDGEHLFKLRNPNGVALWKGKWSREDAERMTFAARKALGLDREDPGVFWMAVDDFLAYFVERRCAACCGTASSARPGLARCAFNGGEASRPGLRADAARRRLPEPHAVRQGEAGAATALTPAAPSSCAPQRPRRRRRRPADAPAVAAAPRARTAPARRAT